MKISGWLLLAGSIVEFAALYWRTPVMDVGVAQKTALLQKNTKYVPSIAVLKKEGYKIAHHVMIFHVLQ